MRDELKLTNLSLVGTKNRSIKILETEIERSLKGTTISQSKDLSFVNNFAKTISPSHNDKSPLANQ